MSQFTDLTDLIVRFRDERDWAQFHTPRDLAAAISIEAAELQELFLWGRGDGDSVDSQGRKAARDEIADILIYALLFSHETGVDPEQAVRQKIEKNRQKYPVDRASGRSTKYTELDEG